MPNHEHEPGAAEREGIVDQQDAALAEAGAESPRPNREPRSTAEREGIVDQQGAAAEAMEDATE
jgi:hypothetical protein